MELKDEKLLACGIYVTSFFSALIGPLIIWLLKKDESPLIDFHGREYLNAFISYSIYALAATLLMFLLIGFVLLPIVGIAFFVFSIIGAVKAASGELYRIPLVIRLF